ncbi:hypothetical protein HU200_016263 [Digitaria exilis]|uniref:Uncharacterized protein n=1 Tax=Digitaria exilis TaxID=1010633 RepID=A0A835KJ65_9POAL|nr:hypothetical protein HU200_016263 [Digitaria exilis]
MPPFCWPLVQGQEEL